jgi:hypothetical protein
MSAGTKRLKKELYGHPSVLGHDVISVGVVNVSGVVGHTVQTDGANGCNRFVLPRGGYLDFAVANVSPVIASGSLNVAVHVNGAVVMSGSLNSSNPAQFANAFHPDLGNTVALASGDVVQCFYAISTGLGSVGVGSNHSLNTRLGITYRDAQ